MSWQNGQGRISEVRALPFILSIGLFILPSLQQLMGVGMECKQKKGAPPNLMVVILPEGGNDIYTAVKQFVFWLNFHYLVLTLVFILVSAMLL